MDGKDEEDEEEEKRKRWGKGRQVAY